MHWMVISSVIRQKEESQNGCFKKQSTPNFPKNEHFLPSDTHTCVCVSRGKKCSFFVESGVLYFLETPVLRFARLSYYRRNRVWFESNTKLRDNILCHNPVLDSFLILWVGFVILSPGSSCYTVSNTIWAIFSKFLIFCRLISWSCRQVE